MGPCNSIPKLTLLQQTVPALTLVSGFWYLTTHGLPVLKAPVFSSRSPVRQVPFKVPHATCPPLVLFGPQDSGY